METKHNNAAQTLKVLSLLAICYGHIFSSLSASAGVIMKNWWVIGDIGMFYFAMSSAYFTALRYNSAQAMRQYWPRKVRRIGLQFLFISFILLLFFIWRGDSGVFTVHTIVNLLGLNGFLNWLGIPNRSPFGAGQWFITLLFLFYLLYPLALWRGKRTASARLSIGLAAVVCLTGQAFLPQGHSLWSTAFGFASGVYLCRADPKPGHAFWLIVLGLVLGAVYKLTWHSPVAAYAIISVLGYALGALTLMRDIPWLGFPFLRPLYNVLLPLYLVHAYFFKHSFVSEPHLNALIILLLNVAAANVLTMIYIWLLHRIEAFRTAEKI